MEALRKIIRFSNEKPVRAGTLAGWFQQACSSGAAILLIPIVVSHLSNADSGLWFTFQGMVALTGLCDFGLGLVVSRQTAYTLHRNPSKATSNNHDFLEFGSGGEGIHQLRKHVEHIYRWTSLAALLLGIIIYELILPHTKALNGVSDNSRTVWYLMLATGLLLVACNRWSSILTGANFVFTARTLFGLFFVVQSVLVGFSAFVFGELVSMSLAALLSACAYLYALRKAAIYYIPELNASGMNRKYVIDRYLVKRLWKISFPIGAANISSFLINSIQVPMLGAIFGPSTVAPFYLAQRILQFASLFVLQPVQNRLSQFTGYLSHGDKPRALHVFQKTILYVLPATIAALATFVFLSPFAAKFLAPGTSYPSLMVLSLLALNALILSTSSTCGQFVLAAGRNPFFIPCIINGLLNLIGLCWLVPVHGIIAIPIVAIISGMLSSYILGFHYAIRLNRELKLP